jgi:hypothetical protein
LRGAIAFWVSDAGEQFAVQLPIANGVINRVAAAQWPQWLERMHEKPPAETPVETGGKAGHKGDF